MSAEAAASRRRIALRILAIAGAIELFTVVIRYGFELPDQTRGSSLARFTGGLRIHHGYVGVLLVLLGGCAAFFRRADPPDGGRSCCSGLRLHLLVWGFALVLSDLVDHLVVLWIVEGSPQFHLFYDGAPG